MKLKTYLNNKALIITILAVIIGIFPYTLLAQTDISDNGAPANIVKVNKWNVTLNGGATLLWGDLSDEPANPFSKYFSEQQGWGYGLILSRRLGKTFTANLQYIGGNLQGYRSLWSNGDVADLRFNSKINDINLNVEVDLMNLIFESKEHRWFSAYIKGGLGYLFYKPVVSRSNGTIVYSGSGSCLDIPWGWGVKSDITKNISIRFENTFHHATKDDVDGHGTIYSHANDIYNYTSLGITYRIYQNPKQPKIPKEENITHIDTAVAVVEPEEKPFELSIAANYPSSMHPYDTSDVTLRITKGDIDGAAKLQQTIPEGFEVTELLSAGANFEFKNQIMTYSWDELPEKENLNITYRLVSKNASMGEHSIPGILFYKQNNIDQIRQFKKSINIIAVPVVAVNNNTDNTNVPTNNNDNSTTTVPPIEKSNSTDDKSLVYRVQVYAVYGGTTSSKLLEKRLNLDYPVQQDYQGNYAKYTSGEFATYEEAAAYKKKLRGSTVPGAFVVGFYEGKRTKDIQEAITIEKGGKISNSKVSIPMGIIYRVQIMASSRDLSISQVREQTGCSESFEKVIHNGLYKYEVGAFKSYSEAKTALQRIRSEVSDAFIVKYKDGKRI